MRAMDIVIYLVCLNAAFFIVDSIGVFGVAMPAGRILTLTVEIGGIQVSGALIVTLLAGAILGATVVLAGSSYIQPIGVVAVAFTGFFTFLLGDAMAILSEIKFGGYGVPAPFLLAFGALNVVVFTMAMIQLVTGGWEGAQ